MHVPFEGPGIITNWTDKEGHLIKYTRFYENETLPEQESVDFLVIMGGPMNVFDYHTISWMEEEIHWTQAFIASGKPVLGICLGAQILATSLGAEVYPGKEKEIGWYNLRFLPALGTHRVCKELPSTRKVFHWHGDTFDIPLGAERIAESQCFANQGFLYENRVLALQFHLEMEAENVEALINNCGDELVEGAHIQQKEELLRPDRFIQDNAKLLFHFLNHLAAKTNE